MKNIEIENLPEAVRENRISKKEAVNIIWEELYLHPYRYGLLKMTEDQRSDFLLDLHDTFEKLFDKFIPGAISFGAYIAGCISNYKMSFLRNQLAEENERKSAKILLRTQTEENIEKYLIKLNQLDSTTSESKKTFSDITGQKTENKEQRKKRIAEITALVLLMKACKDIDDETIESVVHFTGVDKALIYEKIQELKEKMTGKDVYSERLVRKRNNAFFFHRKYMQEMLVSAASESKMNELKEKYDKQTKKWKSHNNALAVRSNTPSNEEVANVIGIKPRMVSFYIRNARTGVAFKKTQKDKDKENESKTQEKDAQHSGKVAFQEENR
ncbi:MAG: hypothetical protein IJ257_08355 [Treponema sp.]|nr:hypothetical protein [Treponema sp.]